MRNKLTLMTVIGLFMVSGIFATIGTTVPVTDNTAQPIPTITPGDMSPTVTPSPDPTGSPEMTPWPSPSISPIDSPTPPGDPLETPTVVPSPTLNQ